MAELPHGANLTPPHPPGFLPIFVAVGLSFLKGRDPETLTEEIMEAILRQSEKFTLKLLAKYPGALPVEIPTSPLPSTWKAGAEIPHAEIPAHWVKKSE